jgi:chromosome segregation ATPase
MVGASKRLRELEALEGKVYRAKELISRLRESNRELASQLEAIKDRIETQEPSAFASATDREEEASSTAPSPRRGLNAEVERLQRERLEIRERVSRLLQQLESLEL